MNEETTIIEAGLRRKWDIPGSALLGAGFGALVQGANEFHHNLIAPSGVQESFASALAQTAVGALAGTVLFTIITVAHNIIVMRFGQTMPRAELARHRSDYAYIGAVMAVLLVLAHEAFNFLSGRWYLEFLDTADPFSHIVWELAIAGIGGELLFRAIAKIRDWDSA